MALSKVVTTVVTNQTVAASSELALANSSPVDLNQAVAVAVEVVVTYHASATLGSTTRIYASMDNTNWTTYPVEEWDDPLFAAGATKRYGACILPGYRYIKVAVKNNDAAQSITAIGASVSVQS